MSFHEKPFYWVHRLAYLSRTNNYYHNPNHSSRIKYHIPNLNIFVSSYHSLPGRKFDHFLLAGPAKVRHEVIETAPIIAVG